MKDTTKVASLIAAVIVLAIATIILSKVFYVPIQETQEASQEVQKIEIENLNLTLPSLENYVLVEPNVTKNSMLLVYNKCKVLAIGISSTQAFSIKTGLENKIEYRPTTHDIIYDILNHFDIKVLFARITEFKSGIFFAELFLQKDNRILNLDIRPSDAIAIAVRTNSSIYLNKDLLEMAEDICK